MKLPLLSLMALLLVSGFTYGQVRTISGVISSSDDGRPLKGVSVTIKGTAKGTSTDEDGKFVLTTEKTSGTLVISSVGMQEAEIPITDANEYNVTLNAKRNSLNEVVITALGVTKQKKALGYSVQELSGDQLNVAKDANIVNSLYGKVAGVQVTSGGSALGSSSRITIRGNSSFGNNTPLFIIDGTPINNSSTNLDGQGGVDYGNVTADIDANNIETMSVLKGSAATALYGSRATNGVILITTKKGTNGKKLNVDISSTVMFDKPSYFVKYQNLYGGGYNGEEFIWNRDHPEMSYQDYAKQYSYNYVDGNGGGVNDANPVSWGPRLDAGLKLDQWSTGPNSPWISRPDNVKDFFRTGSTVENSVAISGHGDKASGRVSYTKSDVGGILWNTNQGTNTLATSVTLTPTDKLTANANVTYLTRESTIPPAGYSGAMIDFGWFQRDFDSKYMKSQFEKMGNKGFISPFLDNMYYKLTNTNTLKRDRMFGNLNVDYKILDWLTATARVGTDFYNEYRKSITQSGTASNVQANRGGQFNQTQLYNKETNADFILNFNKKISSFAIDGLVGANYRDVLYKSMYLAASDLTVPDLFSISNVKGTPTASNYDSEKKMNSVYASLNASYNNYLFLGVTGRNDWSSTLPEANRSYFYPSVSLGFVFTDAFNLKSPVLSFGKIRASWANVGGDTDPYRLDRTYSAGSFGGVSIFSPTGTLPPQNLKPQATKSIEFGGDLRFFNNRIGLDLTYYDQKTINQILSVPVSRTTGYSAELINAGEIENKGVEIILNASILNRPTALSWDMTVNFSKNRNMVNALYGGLANYSIASGPGGITTLGVPGQQWGALYSLGYVRDAAGAVVVDDNGIPVTSNSAELLGNVTPKWTGGIQNTFRYKKLQLSVLIDARWGSQFFSTSLWHGYNTGTAPETVENNVRETGLVVNGVKQDGSKNTMRVSAQEFYGGSWMWNNLEYAILDGSFVKLRELALTYPINVSRIKWLHTLSVSVIGRNLAILYRDKRTKQNGIDPETGFGGGDSGVGWEDFQLPTTRSYGLKLNVGL